MRKSTLIKNIFAVAFLLAAMACERRPLEDYDYQTALIPVKIDWSNSGIAVTRPDGDGLVHRVSIRFFPKDGSPAFDRYLEGNIIEGEIEVPAGNYSVVVFNESVHDIYWSDEIYFTAIDDYADFAANIRPADPANYPYYTLLPDEKLIVEPLSLASWSLDDFEVTNEMVSRSRSEAARAQISRTPEDPNNALTAVGMRPLTYKVTVTSSVENLCSAQLIEGALRGFATKVYMASAQTAQSPATHIFKLNGRKWDDASQIDGTTHKSFLSFGRLPQASDYWLNLDVLFVTGELYDPANYGNPPLLFDISNQVTPALNDVNVNISLSLPYIEGGIYVGDWDDEEIAIQ